jgi:hypothetical protein
MIEEMFKEMSVISILITVLILGFIFLIIDSAASKPEPFQGTVIDKHYRAQKSSTGTGYGMTGQGQTGVFVSSQHEPEKFLLIVKTESSNIVTVECEPELFYKKEVGQKIECKACKGFFTGATWSIYGVR